MANDLALPVRRAGLALLKADVPLVAMVPAARIYPQAPPETPTWPFVKWGSPFANPIRASCVDGAEVGFAVHSFAKPRMASGQMVETAEDFAARIGKAVVRALGGARLALSDGGTAALTWTGSQLLQDGDEADAFHHVANFRARALALPVS